LCKGFITQGKIRFHEESRKSGIQEFIWSFPGFLPGFLINLYFAWFFFVGWLILLSPEPDCSGERFRAADRVYALHEPG
jgi:hypothetical protein